MLGDSFRRLQADELDAEWDQLVTGGSLENRTLSSIVSGLSEGITPANAGARSRIHQQLFASLNRNGRPRGTGMSSPLSGSFASIPLSTRASAKRWWSSPMAAFEVIAACLILAALALGVSLYQAGNDSQQLRTAAERTPATVPTPSFAYFTESWNNARPAMAGFETEIGAGKAWMNLSEIHLPAGADYPGDYGGVNLFMVVRGTVAVTISSGTPTIMTAGDAIGIESTQFSIRNAGTDMAYIIHGLIYNDTMVATPSNDASDASTPLDYQAYFLGNAALDLSSGPAKVSLEIINEKTINRTVQNDATVLLANQADPITLLVTDGIVGIRGTETTSDDYRTGGGYSPIALGTTTIIGMRGSVALAQPGSSYTLSAPNDSQVMAISLSVEQAHP